MRQAIIWTNAGPIHWRIYAVEGTDESKYKQQGMNRLLDLTYYNFKASTMYIHAARKRCICNIQPIPGATALYIRNIVGVSLCFVMINGAFAIVLTVEYSLNQRHTYTMVVFVRYTEYIKAILWFTFRCDDCLLLDTCYLSDCIHHGCFMCLALVPRN